MRPTKPLDTPLYGDPRCGRLTRSQSVDGLVVDETVHEANARVDPHAHLGSLLILVIEGEVIEEVGGRRIVIGPGGVTVRHPGQVHSASFGRPTRLLSLEFTPAWTAETGTTGLFAALSETPGPVGRTKGGFAVHHALTAIAIDPLRRLELVGHTLCLLAELARRMGTPQIPRWLREARDYLEDHVTASVSLAEVAKRVGVHRVHLSRAFHRHYGRTISDFVMEQRIGAALALVTGSDDSMATIATRTGFSGPTQFGRAFRRHLGTSPARFRASCPRR